MTENIKIECPQCKNKFSIPSSYENKKVKCKCGYIFLAEKNVNELKPSIEEDNENLTSNKTVLICGVILSLIIIVSVFLIWFFALHGKWERRKSSLIKAKSELIISLVQKGELEESIANYVELYAIIKNQKIENPELKELLSKAQKSYEDAKNQIEITKILAKLNIIVSQAETSVKKGDMKNGVEKYQQALDLISKNQINSPELVKAQERISQANRDLIQLLEQVKNKKEEELKLEEQNRLLANVSATISGGAWLTKKAGNSELVRGLSIKAIRAKTQNINIYKMAQAAINFKRLESKISGEENKSTILNLEKLCIDLTEDTTIIDIAKVYAMYRAEDMFAEAVQKLFKLQYQNGKVTEKELRDIAKAHILLKVVWETICSEEEIASTQTDIDGKYQFELPYGSYYLYASFESSYSKINWFIPLQVLSNKELKVDFCNQTAYDIENKLN